MPELLTRLREAGIEAGVVTSKRRHSARLATHGVGIDGLIDVIATLEDTERHKPAPDPLLHGARVLGVDPAACVYVGDAVVDVRAARAAGMAAVAVTWGAGVRGELLAAGPDAVADTVAELESILLRAG